jgi:uncharacterized RDD family membrane protein YckC
MSYGTHFINDDYLVRSVLMRRLLAWAIDAVIIGLLTLVAWWLLFWFGALTLGLGFGAMAILPFIPFAYNVLSLLGASSATPGQQICGLTVRRDYDLGPPTGIQALISTVLYYLTLATSGLLLIVAVFTVRHRTLHDLLSGLVVVRVRAMEALTNSGQGWNMGTGTFSP